MNKITLHVPLPDNPTSTSQEKGINWKLRKVFTKPQIVAQKRTYQLAIIKAMKETGIQSFSPFEGPVRCKITWLYGTSVKKQISTHKDTKPDLDNMAKILIDVLADLGFFKVGDQQITELHLYKYWQKEPSVHIELESLVAGYDR